MKEKSHKISLFIQSFMFASFLAIILSTINCGQILDEDDDVCEVEIQNPLGAIFDEGEEITFSANLKCWSYPEDRYAWTDNQGRHPELTGVRWESDVDGELKSQEYNDLYDANHSFTINTLSVGKHTIRCNAISGGFGRIECYDEKFIEILAAKQINRVEFGLSLDIADTKLTQPSGDETYGTGFGCSLNSIWGKSTRKGNEYTTTFTNATNSETTYNGYLIVSFLNEPLRVDINAEWSEERDQCKENFKIEYEGIPFKQSYNSSTWDEYSEKGSSISRINVSNERICTWGTRELLNTNSSDDALISLNVYYRKKNSNNNLTYLDTDGIPNLISPLLRT